MMMLVELSDVAVADELAEEEVDELISELETELDLLEVTRDAAEAEELVKVLEPADEVVTDDASDEAIEEADPLAETDADSEDIEATLALTGTATSLFLDGNTPTKKAESTMYDRSIVLLIGLLDCALLR